MPDIPTSSPTLFVPLPGPSPAPCPGIVLCIISHRTILSVSYYFPLSFSFFGLVHRTKRYRTHLILYSYFRNVRRAGIFSLRANWPEPESRTGKVQFIRIDEAEGTVSLDWGAVCWNSPACLRLGNFGAPYLVVTFCKELP